MIIHPKYRTTGLGAKLIRKTLPKVGTHYVELIVAMVKYSPFSEKAGMKKVAEHRSTENLSQVSVLSELSSIYNSKAVSVMSKEGLKV